mmetsp:Transcript_28014/g.61857  ORF Transcript_28014/g.61857 Transcript_28014/m.61857 type:complete len:241 (+) Transcript_28014:99-821(+)
MVINPAPVPPNAIMQLLNECTRVSQKHFQVFKQLGTNVIHRPLQGKFAPIQKVGEGQFNVIRQNDRNTSSKHHFKQTIAPIAQALGHEAEDALSNPIKIIGDDGEAWSNASTREASEILQSIPHSCVCISVDLQYVRVGAMIASRELAVAEVPLPARQLMNAPLLNKAWNENVFPGLKAIEAMVAVLREVMHRLWRDEVKACAFQWHSLHSQEHRILHIWHPAWEVPCFRRPQEDVVAAP